MRVKAARLTAHGQPLRVEDVELAEPGADEVTVDIAFAGVNPVDMYAAQRVNEAFDRIRERKVRGKIVLDTRA
jgi:D-arabinose 1-dehydrogenase-like Zn-dependent alcohol dehydrogenase